MGLAEHHVCVHCCLQASWHVSRVWSSVLNAFFSLQTPQTRFSACSNKTKKKTKNTADNLQLCATAFASLHLLCQFYSSKDEGLKCCTGSFIVRNVKNIFQASLREEKLRSCCFSLYCSSPASMLPCFFLQGSHVEWILFAWIHVWMAGKAAGSVEQSQQICLFALRQCGTTAMTTGAGLDIYLACWLMSLNCLKAPRGNFFVTRPRAQNTVLSPNACVRFCINTADLVEGQQWVTSAVFGGFFLGIIF